MSSTQQKRAVTRFRPGTNNAAFLGWWRFEVLSRALVAFMKPAWLEILLCFWFVLSACGQTSTAQTGRVDLLSTTFTGKTLPPDWVAHGLWTVDNALQTPSVGGPTCYAYWDQELGVEQTVLEATLRLLDTQTQIALIRRDLGHTSMGKPPIGSIAMLDGLSRSLVYYRIWDGTNLPPVQATKPLPFPLVVGRDFKLTLWKADAGHHGFRVEDTSTGESCTLTVVRDEASDPGKQTDAPGLLFLRGAATCTSFSLSTPGQTKPELMIVGDSISEGEAMKPLFDARYSKLVADAMSGGCVLASKGGENTRSILNRLRYELHLFQPKRVLLELGFNEPTFESWHDGITNLIQIIRDSGSEPLLSTLCPNSGRPDFVDTVNRWVRASGLPFVDFARALSVDPDALTWDVTMIGPDLIHPNPLGNIAMYQQVRRDLPFLFKEGLIPPARRIQITSANSVPGSDLQIPVWIEALGNEQYLSFSVAFDAAAVSWQGMRSGPGLPIGTTVGLMDGQAIGGWVGVTLQLPARATLPPGSNLLTTLSFRTITPGLLPQAPIKFVDRPAPRAVFPTGPEVYEHGTLRISGTTNNTPTSPRLDIPWLDDSLPEEVVVNEWGGEPWTWSSNAGDAVAGSQGHVSPLAAGLRTHYFTGANQGWKTSSDSLLFAYVRYASKTRPRMIMLEWYDAGGSWDHRAYWGDNLFPYGMDLPMTRRYMGPLPPADQWTRLSVPATWVNLAGKSVGGLAFAVYDGAANWDLSGHSVPVTDTIWVSNSLPDGANPLPNDTEPWLFTTANPDPFGGLAAHISASSSGYEQHSFVAPTSWFVGQADYLRCWVYLDPRDPPRMIIMQWADGSGSWNHRAFWGTDEFPHGVTGTVGKRLMGPLPRAGEWTLLTASASSVGLANTPVKGLSFGHAGGAVRWRNAGRASPGSSAKQPSMPRLSIEQPSSSSGGEVRLSWPPAENLPVGVQTSTNLLDWEWFQTPANPSNVGSSIPITPQPTTRVFFRLAHPPD